jgi:phenylalanyl-tRNA synthetase beta chain
MLISLNWVRQFAAFETSEPPKEIAARFSLHTAEVEHVIEAGSGLPEVVAARVVSARPHPDADRLSIVTADVGGGVQRDVVCGAPNVREGMVAPYAPPGASLLGREIREAKVRGILSQGMLCSEKDLGLADESDGLWELAAETPAGLPLTRAFPDLVDVILEVDNKSLTHRPDLWGHYGIAREFSAIYRVPLAALKVEEAIGSHRGKSAIRVAIEGKGVGGQEGLCRRYCGLQLDGVTVGPSPAWLRHRLGAIGARSINNVVDVTNYILFELGQPLHAFDTTRVEGGEIRVRRAFDSETLALLDGSEVTLEAEDLVIADARSAVALAGIMGGAGSQISETTHSIFLESANFQPARVRRTSVRIGKRTDSSLRFEKSLDPENAKAGILRAARMLLDLCPGAKVVGPLQDVGYEPAAPIEISTSAAFITKRLGAEIDAKEVRGTLDRLGFHVKGDTGGDWKVRVPTWRATKDISLREDLMEEVGRIHGYDRIHPFAPQWTVESPRMDPHRQLQRAAKDFLMLHGGMTEVFTYSLVGAAHCRSFSLEPDAHIRLQNPLSEDLDRLRREIVPIHLEKARDNQRFAKTFAFFELGRVYRKPREKLRQPDLPDERSHLAGILSFEGKRAENFYELRQLVLSLLHRLRAANPEIAPPASPEALPPWAHPKVCAKILADGKIAGAIYRVHPRFEMALGLEGDVLAFDLDFDFIAGVRRREVEYHPSSKYPTVPFDVAVVAPERVPVSEIQKVIAKAAGRLLLDSQVFDVFQGGQFGTGKKSVAIHLTFGAADRTLSGDDRKEVEEKVMEALKGAGFPLR